MGTISPATVSDGETIDASDLNNPINTIANEINGNLDNDNIAANAGIVVSKLGTSAWSSWTPTWGNLTQGNGSDNSKYIQIGPLVIAEAIFDFGTTTALAGNLTLSNFPVTADTRYASDNITSIGSGHIFENGVGYYPAHAVMQGSSTSATVRFDEVQSVAALRPVEGTIVTNTQYKPFSDASGAGGSGDGIYLRLMYEAA